MNDNMLHCELPERMAMSDRLDLCVEFVREAMTFRHGYEVEIAALEPIDRDGKRNLLVYWRRKSAALHVVAFNASRAVAPAMLGPSGLGPLEIDQHVSRHQILGASN